MATRLPICRELRDSEAVPIDIQETFRAGGPPLIELLHHCVYAVRMEPIFSYLAQDYRNHPTAAKARALYQNFCAAGAPARLRGCKALPPHNLRIERMMAPLLAAEEPPLPDPRLFDFIVADLARPDDDGPLTTLARTFDPARSAYENLPDGKMTAGQRSFVEKVWRPLVRPALVEVGFWRIGSIGG